MRIATVLAVALLGTTSLAATEHARAAIQHYHLNIPRQPLDAALKDLAQQTGLQIGRFSERIDGNAIVGPVQGDQTPEEALNTLLRRTGLNYKIVGDTTIAVYRPTQTTSSEIKKGDDKSSDTKEGTESNSFWSRFRLAQADQGTPPTSSNGEAKKSGSSTATETSPQGSSGSLPQLEEVIVTAQKRAERLQDVPNAVTAISVDRLQNEAANGLQDYFREIPGLSVQGSQGAEQISIRGITSSGFTGPTVGIYIDDTPIGTSVAGDHASSLAPDLDPGDLQQVEVLRGPQGTLYGAAAIGGLLKYVTVLPNLQDYSGRIEADGSSVDHGGYGYTLRGAFNGPIVTDVLAITASGYFRQDPGYISNIGAIDNPQTNQVLPSQGRTDINEDHDYGGRVAVLWKPEDDLAVKVSALFQHRQNDGGGYESINGLTQQPTSGDLNQISSAYTGASTVKLQVYNAALNWDLHWASLLSSTSYSQNSEQSVTDITGQLPPSPTSGFPPPGYPPFVFPNAGITYFNPALSGPYYTPVGLAYQTDKVTEELRLTSPSSQRLEWQAGLFYTNEETRGEQDISLDNPATGAAYPVTGICAPPAAYAQPYGPPPCAVMSYTAPAGAVFDHSLDRSTYVEYAGYTNSTYHFTDDFSLAAGIRYSENRQTSNPYAVGVLNVVSGSPYASSVENTKGSGNDLTYLVSPTLRISDDAMVYGRVATGYRPGGVNQLLPGSVIPTSFAPDKTTNYELGSKTTLFDGRMSINAAAFLINWSGVQLTAINPQDEFYFANGRTARSKGVELEVVVRPLDGLTIRANGAYDSSSLTADIPLSEGVAGFTRPPPPCWPACHSWGC